MNVIIYVNARAIIERTTDEGLEIVIQTRIKPGEKEQLELPGGQIEQFESLITALGREVKEETGLTVTEIEGSDTVLTVEHGDEKVEVVRPFAVYQTISGPVDSMGVYFRCRAEGDLLKEGDHTEEPRWVKVSDLGQRLREDPAAFSWVDRAGLSFYLKSLETPPQPSG